jgi:hypothetical protein
MIFRDSHLLQVVAQIVRDPREIASAHSGCVVHMIQDHCR